MESKNKNLYKKMFAVMEAIDFVKKTTHVKFGKQDYKAVSEETVTPLFRKELIKNKLLIFPVDQDIGKQGNITKVNTEYKIVDIETGECEILASSGEGADTQDKGAGKAMTYAYKYMLLRTFAIPTGEDPDKVSSAELDHIEKEKPRNGKWKVDGKAYTEGDIKNMMVKKYNGNKEDAKEEWDMFEGMPAEDQQGIIKEILEEISEPAK